MNRTYPIAQVTMLDSNPAFCREGCSEENRAFLLFSIYLISDVILLYPGARLVRGIWRQAVYSASRCP